MKRIPPVQIKHLIKVFFWSILSLLILHYLIPNNSPKTAYSAEEAPKSHVISIPSKARNLLAKLADCESGNRWDIKVMDSNHQYSYSGLQFQKPTFKYFAIKYGLISKDVEDEEIENLIYDKALQFKVAYLMMKDNLIQTHWVICSHRLGL